MERKSTSVYNGNVLAEQTQNAANKQQAGHLHIFIGMRQHESISSLIQNVKTERSKWIKAQNFCIHPFAWQEGYGAFSNAKSQVDDIIRYIQNQEIHHRKETFPDEYRKFLTAFEIEWDEPYIFKEME